MEYVPGKQLVVPDALSRRADLEELLQPVRASMSVEQRARWGVVNPEATFGDVKAGPLPDVVAGPQADHPLVIRPSTLSDVPPVDTRPIVSLTAESHALQRLSMGELGTVNSRLVETSTSGMEAQHSTVHVLDRVVGTGFAFFTDWSPTTSYEDRASHLHAMAGEQPASTVEPYATSHQLLHQLQHRIGKFVLDASPFKTGFRDLRWLKHAHRVRKLWEGKSVLVDCTKG